MDGVGDEAVGRFIIGSSNKPGIRKLEGLN
jgi:hypothetical protein